MSYRSDRFNARMISLDKKIEGRDLPYLDALSDHGQGVETMVTMIDGQEPPVVKADKIGHTLRTARMEAAKLRLVRAGLGYLLPVLNLIIKNGKNRKESIWAIARSKVKCGTRLNTSISDICKNY